MGGQPASAPTTRYVGDNPATLEGVLGFCFGRSVSGGGVSDSDVETSIREIDKVRRLVDFGELTIGAAVS